MQLTQTLEELLDLYGAKIYFNNDNSFVVTSPRALPDTVNKIAKEFSISFYFIPYYGMDRGHSALSESFVEKKITYEFAQDTHQALRALIFLATEKERYNKFSQSIDTEIEQQLSDKEI